MSRTKNPRDHAVNGRDDQAVGLPSYRLSFFFISFSPFGNFRHLAALYMPYWYTFK